MVPHGWVEGQVADLLDGLESGVSVNSEDPAKIVLLNLMKKPYSKLALFHMVLLILLPQK